MDLEPSLVDDQIQPENPAVSKFLFNSRKQEATESVSHFAEELQRLGSAVGASESMVIDRFVAGLNNESARLAILHVRHLLFILGIIQNLIFLGRDGAFEFGDRSGNCESA